MILYLFLFSKAGVILTQWLHSQALLLLIKTPQPVTFHRAQPTVWTHPTPGGARRKTDQTGGWVRELTDREKYSPNKQKIAVQSRNYKVKLTGRQERTNRSMGPSLPDRKCNQCACHTPPQASSPPDHTAQKEKPLIHTSHTDIEMTQSFHSRHMVERDRDPHQICTFPHFCAECEWKFCNMLLWVTIRPCDGETLKLSCFTVFCFWCIVIMYFLF